MFDPKNIFFNRHYLQLSKDSSDPAHYEIDLHHLDCVKDDLPTHYAVGTFVRALGGNREENPFQRTLVNALIHRFNDYPSLYNENELSKQRAEAAYAHSANVEKQLNDMKDSITDHETEIKSLKQQLAHYKQRGIDLAHNLTKANEMLAQKTGCAILPEKLLLTEILGFLSSAEKTSELNARYADRLCKDLINLINNM